MPGDEQRTGAGFQFGRGLIPDFVERGPKPRVDPTKVFAGDGMESGVGSPVPRVAGFGATVRQMGPGIARNNKPLRARSIEEHEVAVPIRRDIGLSSDRISVGGSGEADHRRRHCRIETHHVLASGSPTRPVDRGRDTSP